jgi:CheY-like chemotaxis protein
MSAGKDVLVVEDNRDLSEIMLYVLRRAGYSARCAENGVEALEAVAARMPGVVLLDMLMPVMDGWECAKALREQYGSALPIVVVSAAENVDELRAEVGADDALPKPFDLPELLKLAGRYVEPADAADHCGSTRG